MKIMGIINNKRYFSRVYLWVTSAIILLVTVFSIIVYFNTENIVLKNDYETSKKILYQVDYNVRFMDDMIKNLCKYLFVNSDIQSIMYNNEQDPDLEDIIIKMNKISNSVLTTNPYLHSFYIYNNNNKTYYSTYSRLFFNDDVLKDVLSSYDYVPKLVPIYRRIEVAGSKGAYENVFTYFMYDNSDGNKLADGTVIVNVKFKWLLDNINAINMSDPTTKDQVFLVDKQGNFISNGSGEESGLEKSIKQFYAENKDKRFSEDLGFFKARINNKEYIVTYLNVENVDLMLLKVQPSTQVYAYIDRLKYTIIIITVIFLLLTLGVSVSVTKGIYKPVRNLVNQVRSGSSEKNENSDSKDEFKFLNNVYKSNTNRLTKYETERNSYKEILKAYWLKKLLTESSTISDEDFQKARQEHNVLISPDMGYSVCVFRIDNQKEWEQKYSNDDKDLIKFAIINISSEIISSCYVNDGVDLKDNYITLIINVSASEQSFYGKMEELIRQSQEYIRQYFEISISASISEITENLQELTSIYSNAVNNSSYKFVLGKKSIIFPERVRSNLENKRMDFSFSLEKKLVDVMKSGNLQNIEDSLDRIINNIKELNYNNIIISLLHLVDTVRNTVDEINKSRIEPTYANFEPLGQNLLGMETIDEFREKLMELLKDYFQKGTSLVTDSKHTALVDTVQEVIGKNYHDSDLCLGSIAEMTKMSAKHLGRIFKEKTQMSIPEYINEVRMEKAAQLLEMTDLTVNEISLRVGIANETYFYSIFKKKFGSTPKEYTLKMALNKVDDQKNRVKS